MTDVIKRTAISITLLGESTVGKTCINNVFLGIEFLEEHLTTVGLEKMNAVITIESGEKIKLKIWDTAGQERFRSISSNSLKSSQGAIVVFDLTNRETFEKVTDWLKQIREYSTKIVIGLFGNKSDLEGREVSQEEIDKLCQNEDLIYFETSAKNNTGIQEGFNKVASLAYKVFEKEDIKKGEQLKKEEHNKKKKKKQCC
jgi:small GTP-binding protein